MAIVKEWNYVAADKFAAVTNGFSDVVKTVHFEVFAFDDADPEGARGRSYGEVHLPVPAVGDTSFIAPDQVTTSVLIGWAQDNLKEVKVSPDPKSTLTSFDNFEALAVADYQRKATPAVLPFRPSDVPEPVAQTILEAVPAPEEPISTP